MTSFESQPIRRRAPLASICAAQYTNLLLKSICKVTYVTRPPIRIIPATMAPAFEQTMVSM